MARHFTTSSFGQCDCKWCGRRGVTRFGPPECGATDEIRTALRDFAKEHGRTWKSKLRELWMQGKDDSSPLLRQARNVIGPRQLDKITAAMLARVV
jgi:hypothetical protein